MEVFRKFYSERWSFERWRRAILLQELGEFFYPSLIGDLLSPEHKTSTKTQFLFERMQLRSWIFKLKTYVSAAKMWSNETALKQRKKTFFEPLREDPQSPKSGETEEKYGLSSLFRLQFSCETRLNLPCFSQRENCSPKTPN